MTSLSWRNNNLASSRNEVPDEVYDCVLFSRECEQRESWSPGEISTSEVMTWQVMMWTGEISSVSHWRPSQAAKENTYSTVVFCIDILVRCSKFIAISIGLLCLSLFLSLCLSVSSNRWSPEDPKWISSSGSLIPSCSHQRGHIGQINFLRSYVLEHMYRSDG